MKQKSIVQPSITTSPKSYWISSVEQPQYPQLEGDITTDVAVVGGGITGITTALLLKRAGIQVSVLEESIIGQGTTGHTTAKITSQHGLIYKYLLDKFDLEKAQHYADAMQGAVDFIKDLINDMNIDCDFSEKPAFVYAEFESFIKIIEQETDAAAKLGLPAAYVSDPGLPFKTQCAIRFEKQAQFHPLKYLYRIAEEIPGGGCNIFQNSKVLHFDEENMLLNTEKGSVKASAIVIATCFPFFDKPNLYFSRMSQSRSYLMAVKASEPFPDGMFLSAEDPSRTLRAHPIEKDELIILGETNHDTGQGDNTHLYYEDIKNFAKKVFTVNSIDFHWSAQDAMPVDAIPYIGHLSEKRKNIYVATGFKKWGMTSGTASAVIISDMILGRENLWTDVFTPQRINFTASAVDFIKYNARTAKDLISGRLSFPKEKIQDIKPGTGKIISYNDKKSAVFVDESGQVYALEPYCTHLGCELVWNEAERSWDCPCHGSRFSFDGHVIDGPADKPLKEVDI